MNVKDDTKTYLAFTDEQLRLLNAMLQKVRTREWILLSAEQNAVIDIVAKAVEDGK